MFIERDSNTLRGVFYCQKLGGTKVNYKFKYGNDYLSIPLNTKAAELIYGEISPITDIEKEINHCLDNPIASQPFDEIFRREIK